MPVKLVILKRFGIDHKDLHVRDLKQLQHVVECRFEIAVCVLASETMTITRRPRPAEVVGALDNASRSAVAPAGGGSSRSPSLAYRRPREGLLTPRVVRHGKSAARSRSGLTTRLKISPLPAFQNRETHSRSTSCRKASPAESAFRSAQGPRCPPACRRIFSSKSVSLKRADRSATFVEHDGRDRTRAGLDFDHVVVWCRVGEGLTFGPGKVSTTA